MQLGTQEKAAEMDHDETWNSDSDSETGGKGKGQELFKKKTLELPGGVVA